MEGEPQSFTARLRKLVCQQGEREAIVTPRGVLRFSELDARTNRMARSLSAKGLAAGDLLTIALPNSAGYLETAFACWKLGATPQPVSARFTAEELHAIVELAESPLVVSEADLDFGRPTVSPDALLAASDDDTALPDQIAPWWKAPTSGGSTGRPKLILSGQPAIYTPDFGSFWRLSSDDVALMPGPLFHNGPFQSAAIALLHGATLVLMPRFDAEDVLRQIANHRASWVYLVPTMMNRIMRLPEEVRARYDIASLRTLWHLAAPCPDWLKREWIAWVGEDVVMELYGATEGQAITIIDGREWLDKPGSVGRVKIGQMKVVAPDGGDLPRGKVGEIYARPVPGSPPSYHYRGAESTPLPGGWETVGDIGMMDEDGYVFLADRRTDLILVGGSNVYPAEVEAALDAHPDVVSSAVIGLPDEDLGALVHAIVHVSAPVSVADLEAHVEKRLIPYKRPRTFEIVTTPLRDEAGKVRRSRLRDERLSRDQL